MPRRQIAAVRMMDAAGPPAPSVWLAALAQLPAAREWTPACPVQGPVATLMASRPQLRHGHDRLRRPEVAWAVRAWRAWLLPAAGSPRVDPWHRRTRPEVASVNPAPPLPAWASSAPFYRAPPCSPGARRRIRSGGPGWAAPVVCRPAGSESVRARSPGD